MNLQQEQEIAKILSKHENRTLCELEYYCHKTRYDSLIEFIKQEHQGYTDIQTCRNHIAVLLPDLRIKIYFLVGHEAQLCMKLHEKLGEL